MRKTRWKSIIAIGNEAIEYSLPIIFITAVTAFLLPSFFLNFPLFNVQHFTAVFKMGSFQVKGFAMPLNT